MEEQLPRVWALFAGNVFPHISFYSHSLGIFPEFVLTSTSFHGLKLGV